MSTPRRDVAPPLWPIALGGSLLVAVAFWGAIRFLRIEQKPVVATVPAKPVSPPSIEIAAPPSARTNEQVDLFDNSPLFFPAPQSSAKLTVPETGRGEPGMADNPFPWKPIFNDANAGIAFPDPVALPGNASGALAVGEPDNPFAAVGVRDRTIQPVAQRAGFLEVCEARTGRVIYSAALELQNPPAALQGEWHPLEFLVAINPFGLMGNLTLVTRSGSVEVDVFLQNYFANGYRVGERFPPGFYTLRVGP